MHIRSPHSAGQTTTPHITIAGELWHPVTTLAGHGAESRVYRVITGANGDTHLVFGDGVTGKRPPIGSPITVRYQAGGGAGGNAMITVPPGNAGFTIEVVAARGALHVRHTRHRHP